MHPTTIKCTGILALNSNPDSRFFLAVLIKRKTDFEIISNSNIPRIKPGELLCNSVVCAPQKIYFIY